MSILDQIAYYKTGHLCPNGVIGERHTIERGDIAASILSVDGRHINPADIAEQHHSENSSFGYIQPPRNLLSPYISK